MFQCKLQLLKSVIKSTVTKANIGTSSIIIQKWDLLAAVCLERRPKIIPKMEKIEEDYQKLLSELEFECSIKSDHEMRHEQDIKLLEELKKGGDVDLDSSLKQTAQDFIDLSTEELNQFKPSDRITDADKKNDIKSLNRKLDKHLVFVANQQIGKDKFYLLPQGTRKDGETLRQSAERVLNEFCGDKLKAQIYGNAPSSFYKFKYPKQVRDEKGVDGAKVFIYFARYLKGDIENTKDFKWLDREELTNILPEDYNNSVSKMLIEE